VRQLQISLGCVALKLAERPGAPLNAPERLVLGNKMGGLDHLSAVLRIILLTGLMFATAGCVPRGGRVASGDRDQILYWGNGAEPQDLDPQTVTGVPESHIFHALFEGLVSQDPHDLHPIPGVAQSWDISPDGRVYTFHLRQNAKWSNGDPVTSRDFLRSYQRFLSPALAAQYANMFFEDVEVVNARAFFEGKIKDFSQVGFAAPDDYTFVIHLVNPAAYFLDMLNNYPAYPVHISTILKYGKFDEKSTRWTRAGNLVGNGPFVLKTWKTQQEVVVTKSPTYWAANRVRLNAIHYVVTEDIDGEEHDFRAHLLHLTYDVPQIRIDVYKKDYPQFIQISPYLGTYYYKFNVTNPVLKDKRVRRALAMAIDRQAIVKDVARGGQQPAHCFTPPDVAGFTCDSGIPTDIPAAQKLLAAAGYPDGKGLPPVNILINSSQNHRAVAEAIQQMWTRNLHIDARIQNQEWKVYLDSMINLDYCVARAGWIGDYDDPYSFLGIMSTGNGNNNSGFANPEYDRLLRASSAALDRTDRFADLQKAEAILNDEVPILPIYFYTRVYLKQPSVKGWYANNLDVHMPQFIYLEETAPIEFKSRRLGSAAVSQKLASAGH
jgi:oligopeptide transport system substrate-binding protein